MKKITTILILVFISISICSNAQKFGVKGALNITNLKVVNHDYDAKLGFLLGPTAEFQFGNIFGLETGVLLSTKGGKEKIGSTTYTTSLTYLDFPINVRAGYDFGKYRVYGILGPYIGVGIAGKYKTKTGDTVTKTKVDWGSDADFKRFDAGITIGACTSVSIFELGFTYSHGLVDIAGDNSHKTKNRVFSITAAYKFGKNPFKK